MVTPAVTLIRLSTSKKCFLYWVIILLEELGHVFHCKIQHRLCWTILFSSPASDVWFIHAQCLNICLTRPVGGGGGAQPPPIICKAPTANRQRRWELLVASRRLAVGAWRWLWGGGIGGILVKTATLQKGHTQNGHKTFCYQNGHTAFGQNGHRGRITTKTATLHLVKRATEGGSLPKWPHCIWSEGITTKTATLYFGQKPRRDVLYQNGHTIAKWPQRQRHSTSNTWSLREGGSLPKRPHYCKTATEGEPLPKQPHYSKMATETKTCTSHDPWEREDHYQNGHTIAKWPQKHLTWIAFMDIHNS